MSRVFRALSLSITLMFLVKTVASAKPGTQPFWEPLRIPAMLLFRRPR